MDENLKLTRKQYYCLRHMAKKPVEGVSPTSLGREVLKKHGMNAPSCGWTMLRQLINKEMAEKTERGRYAITKIGMLAFSEAPEPAPKKKKKCKKPKA